VTNFHKFHRHLHKIITIDYLNVPEIYVFLQRKFVPQRFYPVNIPACALDEVCVALGLTMIGLCWSCGDGKRTNQ